MGAIFIAFRVEYDLGIEETSKCLQQLLSHSPYQVVCKGGQLSALLL